MKRFMQRILTRYAAAALLGSALWCGSDGTAFAATPTWLPSRDMPFGSVLLHVEEMKGAYLACNRAAAQFVLNSSDAAQCSLVAEELRRVGFDGHADAMIRWWRNVKGLPQN